MGMYSSSESRILGVKSPGDGGSETTGVGGVSPSEPGNTMCALHPAITKDAAHNMNIKAALRILFVNSFIPYYGF